MLFAKKTVLVTGASRGLGREIAEAFWDEGADLFLAARSADALTALCKDLAARRRDQRAGHVVIDLGAPDAADRTMKAFSGFSDSLDVLVNNAAIQGPIGPLDENDWAEWQATVAVNLLAPVALSRRAIQRMKIQHGGVILNISGGGAATPRPCFSAYATAKAGLVRFTETVAAEVAGGGIRVNAIAPGALNTEMHEAILRAGAAQAGEREYRRALEQLERGGTPLATPAGLAVFLASQAAAGITGRLIHAVWDPWRGLEAHAAELAGSDIYTLRRIVPDDRGLRWQ